MYKTRKITEKLLLERLERVEKELTQRRSSLALERELSNEWNITPGEVQEMIASVRLSWEKSPVMEQFELRACLNSLYNQAVMKGDVKVAHTLLSDLVSLEGKLKPLTQQNTPPQTQVVYVPADLRSQIREMEQNGPTPRTPSDPSKE